MSKKISLKLKKKLSKYSIVGCGMITGINAGVVTTAVDSTLTDTQSFEIDFEGSDGTDIEVKNLSFSDPVGDAMLVTGSEYVSFLGILSGSKFLPYVLTQNKSIPVSPATGVWGKGADNIGTLTYDLYGATRGYWANQSSRYLGIKFEISGTTHYGWVLLSVSKADDEITIHSYAYETDANTGISSPLPVELISFSALIRDNCVELYWDTATEVNNYGFEIERSEKQDVRSEKWEKIGFVNGNGGSNSPKSYSFVDEQIIPGKVYYRLKQIDFDGAYEYSNTIELTLGNSLSREFLLNQNYPNPFNPTTAISYQLSKESQTKLEIFDSIGRLVATLVDAKQAAGTYSYNFNAEGQPSGTYVYRLNTNGFSETKKMLLIK